MLENKIKFSSRYHDVLEAPKPSRMFIPEAYKKMPKDYTDNQKKISSTVKACIPFLDALMTGYTIPFSTDIHCEYDYAETKMNFDISDHLEHDKDIFGVSGHNDAQIKTDLRHNKRTVEAVFKFINCWRIETPPGYSCLFTQPLNQNCPFKIIDGVVDTDVHKLIINFPFYWTEDPQKKVIIKAGDPMVQVIPFKRESWKSSIEHLQDEKLHKSHVQWGTKFKDMYKQLAWRKKSYK